jgi:2-iminobutanoate/2-iminopropanoate deaminase
MSKRVFNSKNVQGTSAPYSQVVISDNMAFISGQVAMDPKTKSIISGNFEEEVETIMNNLKSLLEEMGSSLDSLLKVTVFLTDMNEFSRFNDVYKGYFEKDPPARSCVEVGNLPFDARVEIEAIAHM